MIGDWWNHGEARYGSRCQSIEEWGGVFTYQAVADCAYVARRFESSRRREKLSFTHHREVAKLDPAEADKLLAWCLKGATNRGAQSTRALRARVRELETERTPALSVVVQLHTPDPPRPVLSPTVAQLVSAPPAPSAAAPASILTRQPIATISESAPREVFDNATLHEAALRQALWEFNRVRERSGWMKELAEVFAAIDRVSETGQPRSPAPLNLAAAETALDQLDREELTLVIERAIAKRTPDEERAIRAALAPTEDGPVKAEDAPVLH
jgi:hypothetical protein